MRITSSATVPNLAALPNGVCGGLISPAWVLGSLSSPHTHASVQTHLFKDHYCCSLIQTVLICTPCITTHSLSLWCNFCHKLYRAEQDMLLVFTKTCLLLQFLWELRSSSVPLLTTFKGMSQLLCQHWASEYVWRVSLSRCLYRYPF